MRAIDITGLRVGKLTVIKRSGNDKHRNSQWLCQCDCGITKIIRRGALVNKKHPNKLTKSCGCGNHGLPLGESARNQLYAVYRSAANKRRLNFDLSIEEFSLLTSSNCYYCGAVPSRKHHPYKKSGFYIYNGIDRLDNNRGYELNNCVTSCKTCNYAKQTMSCTEFFDWIGRVYNHIN